MKDTTYHTAKNLHITQATKMSWVASSVCLFEPPTLQHEVQCSNVLSYQPFYFPEVFPPDLG